MWRMDQRRGQTLIISLQSFPKVVSCSFVWNTFLCFFILFDSLCILREWPPGGDEPCHATLRWPLVVSTSFCNCPSSLLHFQWLPAVAGVPRPSSVPSRRISVSTWIHADWKPDPQPAAFIVYDRCHPSLSPTGHESQGV